MTGMNAETMMRESEARLGRPLGLVLTIMVCVALNVAGLARAGDDALTLRINDAVARPGGTLGVVLRTYEPRPVGQGQVCLRLFGAFNGVGPLASFGGATVFSDAEPPYVSSSFDLGQQSSFLSFHSVTAGVNTSDGPMIAVLFDVRTDAIPGSTYTLALEGADTMLVDALGHAIELELRPGELTLIEADAPLTWAADGEEAPQGGTVVVGVESEESFGLGAGLIVLNYDPALVDGVPVVSMDPRHGETTFTSDTTVPGEVRVVFNSPSGTLNQVPGQFVSVRLPIALDAPLGSSPLRIDPSTFALDADGVPIELAFELDVIEIVAGDGSFSDGFETGDLSRWTTEIQAVIQAVIQTP